AWATSGLETALFTLALTGGMLPLLRWSAPPAGHVDGAADAPAPGARVAATALTSGFLFAIAALTRPEALFFGPLAAVWLLLLVPRRRVAIQAWIAWIGVWIACVVPLLAWRASFYGRLLPNSFYVKSPGLPKVVEGLGYLLRAVNDLHLYVPLLAAIPLL